MKNPLTESDIHLTAVVTEPPPSSIWLFLQV